MIEALILLYLSGSIAEETKFARLYTDGSTLNSGAYISIEVVRNEEGKIVYSVNTGE